MSMRHTFVIGGISPRQALAFSGKHYLISNILIVRMDTNRGLYLVPCAHQSMLVSSLRHIDIGQDM